MKPSPGDATWPPPLPCRAAARSAIMNAAASKWSTPGSPWPTAIWCNPIHEKVRPAGPQFSLRRVGAVRRSARIFRPSPGNATIMWLDHWVIGCLGPLAVWILVSGLDDLFVALVRLVTACEPFAWPEASALDAAAQRPIAIFVPLWHEHSVIGQMLDRNLSAIGYGNFQVFAGVYPNDELTVRAVESAARRHPRVHVARCPHGGPTSKGDCLNWIHREMLEYETAHGVRFEILMIHDAEDVVHPESLRLVNWFSREYDMVQIPVLALPTPAWELTHGVYCDEFAESQAKEFQARQSLGGFLPSTGVGTGFGREAMDRLAAARGGRMFDPQCLTEDYETGFALHSLGCRQMFLPVRRGEAGPVATREYF